MNRIINLTDERRERKHEYPKIKPHLPTNPENATYKTSSRHRSPQVCASCRQRGRPHFHSAPDHHHHAPPPPTLPTLLLLSIPPHPPASTMHTDVRTSTVIQADLGNAQLSLAPRSSLAGHGGRAALVCSAWLLLTRAAPPAL